jgi:O-antigen/teichoic acid export membrane protein
MVITSTLRALRTPLALDSAVTLVATAASAALDFAIVALLSRLLHPAGFGVYSVYLTVMTLIGGVSDVGLGLILTRFVAIHRDADPQRAAAYGQLTFWLKLVLSVLMIAVGTAVAPFVTWWLLGESGSVLLFVFALWGAAGSAMSTFVISWLRGNEQFLVRSAYAVGITVVKLGLIGALAVRGLMSPGSAVSATCAASVVTGGLGLLLLPRSALAWRSLREFRSLWNEFATFGKWVAAWFVLGAVIPRLDVLVLSGLAAHDVTGWYAAAARLTIVSQLINTSLMIVLVPKISRIDTEIQLARFLRGWRTLALVTLLGALVPLELAAAPLVRVVFGEAYLPAAPIFQWLLVAACLDLVFNPLTYLNFTSDEPKAIAVLNMVRLVVLSAGLWMLTPRYGALGAARAVVISVVVCYGFLLTHLFARLMPAMRKRMVARYDYVGRIE